MQKGKEQKVWKWKRQKREEKTRGKNKEGEGKPEVKVVNYTKKWKTTPAARHWRASRDLLRWILGECSNRVVARGCERRARRRQQHLLFKQSSMLMLLMGRIKGIEKWLLLFFKV